MINERGDLVFLGVWTIDTDGDIGMQKVYVVYLIL